MPISNSSSDQPERRDQLPGQPAVRVVSVPWRRMDGWIERYESRHPQTRWTVSPTRIAALSADGSTVSFDVPVAPLVAATMPGLLEHLGRNWHIGVLLVRRGGFAVARLVGDELVDSKVGQRHVQGRSKAGGWSQRRFARRRDNQARVAFDAAGGYVRTLLVTHAHELDLLAVGGDRAAAQRVLAMPALATLATVPQVWMAGLPEPRRSVLDAVATLVCSVRVEIADAGDADDQGATNVP